MVQLDGAEISDGLGKATADIFNIFISYAH